ncbi:putative reverse transcriptase domain-containing protein [Tanacetum coccineum]
MSAAAISKLVADKVAEALAADRATRNNPNVAGGSGGNGSQGGAPTVRKRTFAGFMKCGPTQFHGNERVVKLCCWFEKTESVFGISECAEMRMSVAAISKLVADKVAEALESNRAARNNPNVAGGSGGNGGQGGAPPIRECTLTGFMKCGPTQFYGNEGAVELCHWFEKTKRVFGIITTLGLDVVNEKSWTDMRKMMMEELCPGEEVQRLENELRNLKLRDTNIAAYTQRFNELALLCPKVVPTEKKKVELYIKGLLENIKGETTSSRPAILNEAIRRKDTRRKRVPKRNDPQGGNATGRAYAIREAKKGQRPNVVAGTFLINNRYASVLFDSGSDKSFVNDSLSHLIDIKSVRLNTSYEVELADGRIVSTNTVLRGCSLNLINHLFEIDLMPMELGTFDIVIRMDWLVEHDAVIVCGKKEVHIPVKNKVLVVKGNEGVSRLKVISCIKARKYMEKGS